jgi:hypothetical protein
MRHPHPSHRRLVALTALALTQGCAGTTTRRDRVSRDGECQFSVLNKTPHALEVRQFRGYGTIEIGALNPDELLTESAPCADGRVDIAGVPIPMQVGAPVSMAFVRGSVGLAPGTRPMLTLYWP